MRIDKEHSVKLLLCLGTVYLVWGSSFMFYKIAVTHLPLALFCSIRFLAAGALLSLFARYVIGDPWPRAAREWRHVLLMGFLMVFASNGLNSWALLTIPSNESALLNGTAAFWIAGLGVFGPRGHPLTRRAVIELARARGIPVIERAIWPTELATAQEVFLTGTAAEITPVGEIGEYRFAPGAVTRQLLADFDVAVGRGEAAAAQ